jgi:hypothetical protein
VKLAELLTLSMLHLSRPLPQIHWAVNLTKVSLNQLTMALHHRQNWSDRLPQPIRFWLIRRAAVSSSMARRG